MADVIRMLKARQNGRTQNELAAELKVSAAFLCMVLKGKRPPGKKIQRALGLTRVTTYRRATS